MADFIETEALDVDSGNGELEGEDIATVSDEEFIDDDDDDDSSSSLNNENYSLTNVTRNYVDVINERTAFIEANASYFEARHYFDSDEEEPVWHDFSNFKTKVKLFKQSLIAPHGIDNLDSFFLRNSLCNSL